MFKELLKSRLSAIESTVSSLDQGISLTSVAMVKVCKPIDNSPEIITVDISFDYRKAWGSVRLTYTDRNPRKLELLKDARLAALIEINRINKISD